MGESLAGFIGTKAQSRDDLGTRHTEKAATGLSGYASIK
jgi:hypothetical protein